MPDPFINAVNLRSSGKFDSWIGEGWPGSRFTTLGSTKRRTMLRTFWMGCSVAVILYSIAVLTHIAWMGTVGARCMFGTKLGEQIPPECVWHDSRPQVGDSLLLIGQVRINEGIYADYLQAMRGLNGRVGQTIDVEWRDQASGEVRSAAALVQYPPARTYFWSCVWFLQELLIFGIGARVFWKRPDDDSAQWFFVLCIVTVGAYMGGYHWTEIVVEPALIYPFALVRRFRAGGQPSFLSGFSAPQSDSRALRPRRARSHFTELRRPTCLRSGERCIRRAGSRCTSKACAQPRRSILSVAWRWDTSRLPR